ncbi:DUF5819 family protein [Phytoactinopolyspora halophila]|uniref:DUF5819 family protein n=1 Tax=Phytoactinopolyspora halophila TaxID=1981511 RepID=UPI001313DC57|nr:DUF5819 family protein [Phytoactinopolyspora halophila]
MSESRGELPQRVRISPVARGVAFVLVGLLGMHMLATFLWNAPSNPVKEAVRSQVRDYITPVFYQNWSLFAPNPVNGEGELLVRARYFDPESEIERTTEWISATQLEWSEVRHDPAPSRASRLSSNLYRRLNSAWHDLDEEQQDIMAADFDDMSTWKPLAEDLIEAQGGDTSSRIARMVRGDRVATGYATQVARARWDEEIVAVQFRLRRTPVPRWEERFEVAPEDQPQTHREFGWRPVLVNDGQHDGSFAATFRRLEEPARP